MKIFVIGFIGSNRIEKANAIADEKGYTLLEIDKEIEKNDGRSLKRLCMMMGEHEYRNQEYEVLEKYSKENNIVFVCGDGVVHDDMSRDILKTGKVIFIDEPVEILWSRVKDDDSVPYAFMYKGTEEERYNKFMSLYESRKDIYAKLEEESKANF